MPVPPSGSENFEDTEVSLMLLQANRMIMLGTFNGPTTIVNFFCCFSRQTAQVVQEKKGRMVINLFLKNGP